MIEGRYPFIPTLVPTPRLPQHEASGILLTFGWVIRISSVAADHRSIGVLAGLNSALEEVTSYFRAL